MKTTDGSPESMDFQENENSKGILYVRSNPAFLGTDAQFQISNGVAGVIDFQQNKAFELQELNSNDFKSALGKISTILDDILKNQDSQESENEKNPISSKGLSKRFSLEEIEINLGVEAGAQFFVTAKGNAGLTLKYRRRK